MNQTCQELPPDPYSTQLSDFECNTTANLLELAHKHFDDYPRRKLKPKKLMANSSSVSARKALSRESYGKSIYC